MFVIAIVITIITKIIGNKPPNNSRSQFVSIDIKKEHIKSFSLFILV
jgi:hypothetical protein